jgi:hypothetical protein
MYFKILLFGYLLVLVLSSASAEAAVSPSTPSPDTSAGKPQWKSIPEDISSWRREPFKEPETSVRSAGQSPASSGSAGTSPDLILQGIMKSNRKYYAIIDGRTVKPGDRIDSWRISEISRYRVILRREKEKQIYDIYQGKLDRGTR